MQDFYVPRYLRTPERYDGIRQLAIEVGKEVIRSGGISYQEVAEKMDLEFNFVRYLMRILKKEYPNAHQKVRSAQLHRKTIEFYYEVKAMTTKEELENRYTRDQVRHFKLRLKDYDSKMLCSLEYYICVKLK